MGGGGVLGGCLEGVRRRGGGCFRGCLAGLRQVFRRVFGRSPPHLRRVSGGGAGGGGGGGSLMTLKTLRTLKTLKTLRSLGSAGSFRLPAEHCSSGREITPATRRASCPERLSDSLRRWNWSAPVSLGGTRRVPFCGLRRRFLSRRARRQRRACANSSLSGTNTT